MFHPSYLKFRADFEKAMDPRLYTIGYLDRLLAEGQALFWATDKAAIVAEVKIYPTGAKVIHGLVAAGKLEDIANLLIPEAEQWGREHGCIGAMIDSREGWGKVLKSSGYAPFQQALWKDL